MNGSTILAIAILITLMIIVIVIIIYVYKSEKEYDKTIYKATCLNCEYYFEYNDGHGECYLGIEHVCIDNDINIRYFKKEKKDV